MRVLDKLIHRLIFSEDDGALAEGGRVSRYRRMWRKTVMAVSAVAVIPLVFLTIINYSQFHKAFTEEMINPVNRVTSLTQHSLESFLEERISALKYLVRKQPFEVLSQQNELARTLRVLKSTFGGFVDIGIIDSNGVQLAYAGPYDLLGKNYSEQTWFNTVYRNDSYVSECFLGHRNIPHFIIAVKQEDEQGRVYFFRVTVDSELLEKQLVPVGLKSTSDAFLVNRDGVLQTPSRLFGNVLEQAPLPELIWSDSTQIVQDVRVEDRTYLMGYSWVEGSPFVFVVLTSADDLKSGWLTFRGELFAFLAGSVALILVLVMGITSSWVNRIRESDLRRLATLHDIEHTNKMASIGRLAAGVAHEINNPLAIINEKAGLMKDLIARNENLVFREKMVHQVDSILNSVKRCSTITHRLLGFAKHIDLQSERIALEPLIREVLGFLEKEASFRQIHVKLDVPPDLPTITSDRGQLQQLFLNLVNNAFDAMDDGGHLEIRTRADSDGFVEVRIADDGHGIPREHLERIFEPFFTTKKTKGTGLGLSICYGIVQKLNGTMSVDSEVNMGTTFTIRLPIN